MAQEEKPAERVHWTKYAFFAKLDDLVTEVKASGVENWWPWIVEWGAAKGLGFARGFIDVVEEALSQSGKKKSQ